MESVAKLEEHLMASPGLEIIYDRVSNRLAEERARRKRFYAEMTEQRKMEYINGEIVFHSPARLRHIEVSDNIHCLLRLHVIRRGLGLVAHEKMLVSLTRNDYEPDICFFGAEKAEKFSSGQMRFPAPDLVVEILSASTEQRDRGVKFQDYAAHGVAEYWIVDADAGVVEQYAERNGEYVRLAPAESGEITSAVLPGFRVPSAAFFSPEAHCAALAVL